MAISKVYKVLALPGVLDPNGIYLIANGAGKFDFYVADSAGTGSRKLDQSEAILGNVIAFGTAAPDAATSVSPFWWDSSKGTLFVKYTNGGSTQWVEAQPTAVVPMFAGNGTADTMSHSDHWHTSIVIEAEW